MSPTRGVLVLAVGPPRYHQMARALLLSIRRCHPDWALAAATDRPRTLRGLVDEIVPVQLPDTGPYGLKLSLDLHTPFDRTLVLDVDSLLIRPVPQVWSCFEHLPVGVLGFNVAHGTWFGREVAQICADLGTPTLPRFNGGLCSFDQSDTAHDIFDAARGFFARYEQLGFAPFRGGRADEPMLAMALATRGIRACQDRGLELYRTTRSAQGPVHLDVLAQDCSFTLDGRVVRPGIVHFPSTKDDAVYRREARLLRLHDRGTPRLLTRALRHWQVGRG